MKTNSRGYRFLGLLVVVLLPLLLAGCEGTGTVTVQPNQTNSGTTTSTTPGTTPAANPSTSAPAADPAATGLNAPLIVRTPGTAEITGLDGEPIQTENKPAATTPGQTPAPGATPAPTPAATPAATTAPKPAEKDDDKAQQPTAGTIEVGSSRLNVRTSPWGDVIDKLSTGSKVEIVGKEGDWFKIKHNGKTAYIHSNYVSTNDQKASQQAPTPPQTNNPPTVNAGNNSNDTNVAPGSGRFGAPVVSNMPSRTSSEWGPRSLYGRSFHHGTDLPIPTGTSLHAMGDGVVTAVSYEAAGGKYVKIKYDNGYESVYCHLQSASVSVGQRVAMGQVVAKSDNTGQSTGPHLHLGIRKNGVAVNPRTVPGIKLPPR